MSEDEAKKLEYDLSNHMIFAVRDLMRKHPELESIPPEQRTILYSAGVVSGHEMAITFGQKSPDRLKQFVAELDKLIAKGGDPNDPK